MTTVYVSIGNSDDKLTQQDWAEFYRKVNLLLRGNPAVKAVHGQWVSEPASAWQNACWCVELDAHAPAITRQLKGHLGVLARRYRQDAIAWAECPATEFLPPADESEAPPRLPTEESTAAEPQNLRT